MTRTILKTPLLKHQRHRLTAENALPLLAVQVFLLKLLNGLFCGNEGLCQPPVTPTVAGGNEVGDATGLEEGVIAATFGKVRLTEADHLCQAETHHRRLGVVAVAEAVDEAGGAADDVLQRK